MSSPVNDDHHDKRTMYAPPWARETAKQSPEAIVAAIERLRLERQRTATVAEEGTDAGPQQRDPGQNELPLALQADPSDIEAALASAIRASKWAPRSLDPVAMPEPPEPRVDGATWGMVARLGGAITTAAIVALFVTGALRLPSIGFSLGASESARAGPAVAQAPGAARAASPPFVVADASAAPAPAAAAPIPVTPVIVSQATAAPSGGSAPDLLAAYASLDPQPAAASLKAKNDDPQAAVVPAPKPSDGRAVDRDELAGLVKRGQALLTEGDIASARLLLRRAAEAGDANAALLLAGSYDRAELARLKVIGVADDPAQAKLWYAKAVERGSAEAVRRLQQLAQRGE